MSLPFPSRAIPCAFLLAGLILCLGGCGEKTAAPEKGSGRRGGGGGVAPVYVAKVQRKVAPLVLDAVGTVEPIHTAALKSQITGILQKINFQEGQEVAAGDLLFEIDPRPFQNALRSAEADRERLRVQLENARQQVKRYSSLHEGAIVSQEQFQQIEMAARVAEAQLAVSESNVASAKLQLDYCSIRSPFGGLSGNLGVHVGDLVRASDATTSLVTLNQLSPIYVTVGVPQQHLPALAKYRASGEVTLEATPSGANTHETGALTFVDNAVDPATGTMKLKGTFPNDAHRLWPGQFVAVRMTLASPEALVVPVAALQNGQKGQYVFVVKADQTAELRLVTVERTVDNDAVITDGLKEGETVVTDGQLRVADGRPVEIKETAAQSPTAPKTGKRKRKTE